MPIPSRLSQSALDDEHASSLFSPKSPGLSSPSHVVDTTAMRKGEDEDGNKTINEYAVVTELGRGAYGKVKLVTHIPTDTWYAIKILNKHVLSKVRKGVSGKTAMDDVYREIAIMKLLDHPNVVKLHEVINDPHCKKLYLIIDYVENGPIWKVNSPALEVSVIQKHLVGMCQGLDYLHTNNVLHRDIKPDNLLVDGEGTVRWCDFGVSGARDADGDGEDDLVVDTDGTPAFLSPEQCRQESVPGRMVDMWALGVTLYCMTYGKLPFTGRSVSEVMENICTARPTFEGCSCELLQDVNERLLHKDLDSRLGRRDGVREILRHEFLAEADGATEQHHRKVSLAGADWFAAVKTGRNIQLKMATTVGAALKIDMLKRRFEQRRSTAMSGSSNADPVSPQSDSRLMAAKDGGESTPKRVDTLPAPPDLCTQPTDNQRTSYRTTSPTYRNSRSSRTMSVTELALAERPGTGLGGMVTEWDNAAQYISDQNVAALIDSAVRELCAARPENVSLWLSEHFEKQRSD